MKSKAAATTICSDGESRRTWAGRLFFIPSLVCLAYGHPLKRGVALVSQNDSIPDVYHPNQVDLHLDEVQQEALAQLGLTDKVKRHGMDALSAEQAAQLGQVMAEGYKALASNVNQQSE
jgi:hypothetical protein